MSAYQCHMGNFTLMQYCAIKWLYTANSNICTQTTGMS